MKQEIVQFFNAYPEYAIFASIAINIVVAILGVLPSVFVTAANVLFFGFWKGALISFAGETIGAFIAFLLYRFGFKKGVQQSFSKYPAVNNLLQYQGRKAFFSIVSLRLIPLVPSGLITFAAAIGRVNVLTFFAASSLGKIPALLFEAYAAFEVTNFSWQGKLILLAAGIYLLYFVVSSKTRE